MRFALVVGCLIVAALPLSAEPLKTYDGKHDISTIQLTVVYFVPKDRTPLPDWRERVDYFVKRIATFHEREFDGESRLKITVHPKPLVPEKVTADLRKRTDGDFTFFRTMDAVKTTLPWKPDTSAGFPILLVMSDMNMQDLDDFRRERMQDGKPVHEGNLSRSGRHFPGSALGGARATYIAKEGYGMGLVSADGWRVPYSGSDCVVYHEGLGHTIGLPHPNPGDDSVMGTAQYKNWIAQSYLNTEQKRKLGWKPKPGPDTPTDLFSQFVALPTSHVPKVGEPVTLALTWPKDAKARSLTVRTQTDLWGPWISQSVVLTEPAPTRIPIGSFDRPTPVSYRVDAVLENGQSAEVWGYFQVKAVK